VGGTVSSSSGNVVFTPTANFNRPSFTYTIIDGKRWRSTATVNLAVNPVNDAPVANPMCRHDQQWRSSSLYGAGQRHR
jgi:hypothetical protein